MQRLVLVSAALLCSYSYSNAQVSTTYPLCSTDGTTNPAGTTQCLDPNTNTIVDILDQGDFGTGKHNQASGAVGVGGESVNQVYHMTDRRTGAILSTDYILHFSYTNDTWVTNMAIDQALVGAGFDIAGYTAQWQWKNENTNTIGTNCLEPKVNGDCLDDLVITIDAYASGVSIYSEEWDYSQTKSNGYTVEEVLSFAPFALVPGVTIDEIEVSIRGKDNGYWQGMYGPKVQNLTGGLVLMPNQCSVNPLSDPTCPGYANALFLQQCTLSPLYDPSCPGYAAAYLAQQCAANPLYDTSCSGYAQAYYNQQCALDPLYDSGCQGYQQAYLNQQCALDPLYDKSCTGYADAYLTEQCYYDPLYDVQCTGYQQAYFDKECEMDSQYDPLCPSYLDPEIVDLGGVDPIEDIIAEPDIPVIAELDFTTVEIPEPVIVVVPVEQEQQEEEYDIVQGDLLQMEDDIEKEIAALEAEEDSMGNELVMEDDIENEIEELENSTGDAKMEDDIEKELAEIENDANNDEGDAKQEDDIEKEIAELEESTDDREDFQDPTQKTIAPVEKKVVEKKPEPKKSTRNDKIRLLLAQKAIELTKQIEQSATIEQQMIVQRQLLALISYVPGFDYKEKKLNQVNFYPPKPVVDHAYARWFLNDPTFGAMEDSQYNFK